MDELDLAWSVSTTNAEISPLLLIINNCQERKKCFNVLVGPGKKSHHWRQYWSIIHLLSGWLLPLVDKWSIKWMIHLQKCTSRKEKCFQSNYYYEWSISWFIFIFFILIYFFHTKELTEFCLGQIFVPWEYEMEKFHFQLNSLFLFHFIYFYIGSS